MREPETAAQARRTLGEELAAYRAAAGYYQARLAALTDYSRSTIANVETGRQRVARAFWERADAALRTGGVLASAYDEIEASARQKRQATARAVSAARQTRAKGVLTATPASAAASGVQPAMSSLSPADLEPASSPDADAITDGTATGTLWPLENGALTEQAAGPHLVSSGDLARLRSMREHLKAIDNAHGGGAALPMASWYLRHEVPALADGLRGDLASRSLIDVVALFHLDLGWMAYDAGQQPLATANFTRALRLARASGNGLLGGRVLAAMSHQAIELGQLRQAIDYVQAARTATRLVATPRTVAMLAAMEACAGTGG